jgi:threonine/homoserine/homoserine lactone efflux protein
MDQYLVYLLIVVITVASPGPGVILTLSNAIRYGVKSALFGVVGIASGILIIAIISASSLGVLLATSAVAFTLLKFVGAAYLVYLGVKLWCSSPIEFAKEDDTRSDNQARKVQYWLRFKEGFLITLLNPKPIFFFMSLFPQFINHQQSYSLQFTILTLTFCAMILVVHSIYVFSANSIKGWLSSPKGSQAVNRIGGSVFVLFGFGLATTQK